MYFGLQVLDCYVQLSDWESAREWQEAFIQLREESLHNLPQPQYDVDTNLIRSVARLLWEHLLYLVEHYLIMQF